MLQPGVQEQQMLTVVITVTDVRLLRIRSLIFSAESQKAETDKGKIAWKGHILKEQYVGTTWVEERYFVLQTALQGEF